MFAPTTSCGPPYTALICGFSRVPTTTGLLQAAKLLFAVRNVVGTAVQRILVAGVLTSELLHESGLAMRVVAAAIDCGFKDAQVLRFTRDRYARRVYAVKGRPGQTPIWPRKPSRKNQTPFFMVGVDAAKTVIYDRMKIQEPGPGFCHFPLGRELEYFEQLTAEKKFTRYHNGFPKQEWKNTRSVASKLDSIWTPLVQLERTRSAVIY
jgi:phage terminase large subunit GpA-like protein